ncbi:DapH/DapD/GlmU-related protein [Kibdelosporangium aridum]|uniref:Transferase hexapeptide (Six repeat-containing protein) n=1 Tax=Kibdelosporangium aridum TaxID=2030 RepID=A0A1Y5Y9M4_KIBAR|nr:DapH/DapD/GlmU-related protein [Kibdelosporangium aridum]SMD27594.1 transferase hexapeptide (six repeat-containing protein) [Kibdelosporangium aridum]
MILRRGMTADELDKAGLLNIQAGADISRFAVFIPTDAHGASRTITLGEGTVIGAFAVVHGGTQLGEQARVEEHTVVGKPELGYAVGETYSGAGALTQIDAGTVVRSGAVVYAAVTIGHNTIVGHHTVLRTAVRIGDETQLGHHLVVEREARIGHYVRCSPGSHLTSSIQLADRVFLGAGIRTINDKTLTWRHPYKQPKLKPPSFGFGAKVGSGTTVLSGVAVGEHAFIGAGSLVTKDIPAGALAYGTQLAYTAGPTHDRSCTDLAALCSTGR